MPFLARTSVLRAVPLIGELAGASTSFSFEPVLTADPYTSLDWFPLRWRFTAARLGVPADEVVVRLKPFAADAAARAARIAAARRRAVRSPLVSFRSDDPPGAVRDTLRALPVDASTEIVLSWNMATALQTDWETFIRHWDDFCYPASDNVVSWPVTRGWTLCYHHYEVFQFQREVEASPGAPDGAGADR